MSGDHFTLFFMYDVYFSLNIMTKCLFLCSFFLASDDGVCPAVAAGFFGLCSEDCSTDVDCPGDDKCCSNGCGHLCVAPGMEMLFMLCCVMLCYVMLCYVMLCYVMLCYVMLFMLCYVSSPFWEMTYDYNNKRQLASYAYSYLKTVRYLLPRQADKLSLTHVASSQGNAQIDKTLMRSLSWWKERGQKDVIILSSWFNYVKILLCYVC